MSGVPPDYVMPDYRMTVRFALRVVLLPISSKPICREGACADNAGKLRPRMQMQKYK